MVEVFSDNQTTGRKAKEVIKKSDRQKILSWKMFLALVVRLYLRRLKFRASTLLVLYPVSIVRKAGLERNLQRP